MVMVIYFNIYREREREREIFLKLKKKKKKTYYPSLDKPELLEGE